MLLRVTPLGWFEALKSYDYDVDFSGFPHIQGCEGPPKTKFSSRADTIGFESHFRSNGQSNLCTWLEVIYWKMFSQPKGRAVRQVIRAKEQWSSQNVSAGALWDACEAFTNQPGRGTFMKFLDLFKYASKPLPIAIAGTFPAFMNPDDFPMIDTRVAKWVIEFSEEHNAADPTGPQLQQPEAYKRGRSAVLTMADIDFMDPWTKWCRHTAKKLSKLSRRRVKWRARDVEMAVFRAWGSRHPADSIRLEPLPAL